MRKLKYRGKKELPITIKGASWLSEPALIDKNGSCVCSDSDAKALLEVNPKMFKDLGPVEESETVEVKDQPVKGHELKASPKKGKKE